MVQKEMIKAEKQIFDNECNLSSEFCSSGLWGEQAGLWVPTLFQRG